MTKEKFHELLEKHKTKWIIDQEGRIITEEKSSSFDVHQDPITWVALMEGKGDFGSYIGGAFVALGMDEELKEEIADASVNPWGQTEMRKRLLAILGLEERHHYLRGR